MISGYSGRVNVLDQQRVEEISAHLGVEPLSRGFTVAYLTEAAAKASKKPAKIFLMDQRFIAGLGNIYSAEALFVACINPKKAMKKLGGAKIAALHAAIPEVLKKAIKVTTRSYKKPGFFEEADFGFTVARANRASDAGRRSSGSSRPAGRRSSVRNASARLPVPVRLPARCFNASSHSASSVPSGFPKTCKMESLPRCHTSLTRSIPYVSRRNFTKPPNSG